MPYLLCLPSEKSAEKDWYNNFWYDKNTFKTEVIKVIEKEPKISSNLQIDGKVYQVNGIYFDNRNHQHLVETKSIKTLGEPKTSTEDNLICPFCNHIHEESFKNKMISDFTDEGYKNCENCGLGFEYEVSVKVSYKVKIDIIEI